MGFKVKDANGNVVITPKFDAAYSASKAGLVPAATAAELLVMQGAANVVHRIKKIHIEGDGGADTINLLTWKLNRWSSAGTVGSAVLTAIPTQAQYSKGASAPTLVISTVGTAAYTTAGTNAGILATGRCWTQKNATFAAGQANVLVDLSFGWNGDQCPTLEGASDWLVLTATAVVATARLDITVQWEEGTY